MQTVKCNKSTLDLCNANIYIALPRAKIVVIFQKMWTQNSQTANVANNENISTILM